jgi:putative peptidoglycan lipid II flippase
LTRALENPVVRGGVTLAIGVFAGNVIGFARVALTAYLLGTHSRADSLAVAMGPVDSLNLLLINSMVFTFVPMLAAERPSARNAIFLRLRGAFFCLFLALSVLLIAGAPWLMRILAPGLDAEAFHTAVVLTRILAVSSIGAGVAALYWALLYTERRFGPTAFYQATLNLCTIVAALGLWRTLGVYAFAVGYALGAFVQLAVVHLAARPHLRQPGELLRAASPAPAPLEWRRLLAKPAFFVAYAAGLALNVTFTRAYATHAGPGMAAAMEYCLRGVGVPLAILVSPLGNSLLPEIARLRSLRRFREALRIIDRTVWFTALIAIAMSGMALLLRHPAIALLFERGSFTPASTRLVAAVFLGFGPTLIGWSIIEIAARSLFALDRPWPAVLASLAPVLVNAAFTLRLRPADPQWIGAGASLGAFAGAALLLSIVHWNRARWFRAPALPAAAELPQS